MRYKLILSLSVLVGTLSAFSYSSEQSVDVETSVCESQSVLMDGLPRAVSDKFTSLGTTVNTSDIEVTNVSQSETVKSADVVLCRAGLRYQSKKGSERFLVDYTVNKLRTPEEVIVTKINYL